MDSVDMLRVLYSRTEWHAQPQENLVHIFAKPLTIAYVVGEHQNRLTSIAESWGS
jgi:hypothetical protein